jgi:DNA polymerase-3 subunit alpha
MLAGLIEGARWRVSREGRRFLTATISDASGHMKRPRSTRSLSPTGSRAKSSSLRLMTVELDRRPGDDMPRVTVKKFQPLTAWRKGLGSCFPFRIADSRSSPPLSASWPRLRAAMVWCARSADQRWAARRRWSWDANSAWMPTRATV